MGVFCGWKKGVDFLGGMVKDAGYEANVSAVVMAGCLAAMDARAEVLRALVPEEMLGDVDAADLEDDLWDKINSADNISTRDMNFGGAVSLALWESKMLQVYVRLSAVLSEADARALVKEQLTWSEKRDKLADENGASEKGGSAEGIMVTSSLVAQTKKRVAVLEERLAKMGGAK